MSSSFGSLNTALTGLYANRRGLDVSGQNIANSNTEGYTRQRVQLKSIVGGSSAAMYARSDGLGDGVEVTDVQRLRNQFLEERGRNEHATGSYLINRTSIYNAIEDSFAEPSDTALQAQFHDMWGGWADVANAPNDPAARSAMLQQSATVVDGLHGAYGALASQWKDLRGEASAFAAEVNQTAEAIAELNKNIVLAKASGATVNELEDQRDLHAMHLAEMVGATTSKRANGAMDVFVGGTNLVSQYSARKLEVTGAQQYEGQGAAGVPQLRWASTGTPGTGTPVTAGGRMGAMMDGLTTVIPGIVKQLDDVASKLAARVNALHATGIDLKGNAGQVFFKNGDFWGPVSTANITARNITLNMDLDKPELVAAGRPPTPPDTISFDGSVADELSRSGELPKGPDKAYQSLIGELGVESQTYGRRADIQSNITLQIDSAREAEAGVNLDEEMTNLLTFQRGYEAASRVLTTIDAALDQLINRTGLVGR